MRVADLSNRRVFSCFISAFNGLLLYSDGAKSLPEAEAHPSVTLPLLPYQKEGLGWMIAQESSEYHGGVLADEMGMGKVSSHLTLCTVPWPHAVLASGYYPEYVHLSWWFSGGPIVNVLAFLRTTDDPGYRDDRGGARETTR